MSYVSEIMFHDMVVARLGARKAKAVIHHDEMALLAAARQHGVGPDDTACQIIADREDHMLRIRGRRGYRGGR